MKTQSLSIRSALANGQARFEISGQPGGFQFHDFPKSGIWRFTIHTGLGQYNAEKLFVTLPVTAWRSKEYRIGAVNVDFVDSGRMVVPQMECWVNGVHYHNVWFQVPSRAEIAGGRFEAICAVPIEDPAATTVEFRLLDPIEVKAIEVVEDERQQLLDKVGAGAWPSGDPSEQHPRMFVDCSSLKMWRERARSTHAKEWKRIETFLEQYLLLPVEPMPARNEDDRERLDLSNRVVLYAFGWRIAERDAWFDSAWAVAQEVINLEHWGWKQSTGKTASFMTHYGCDNDMCQGHTEMVSLSLFYDWCYEALTEEQRRQVAAKLAHHAEILHRHSVFQLSEWASQYISDHHTGSMACLNLAAFALLGRDPRALEWLKWCRAVLEKAVRYLPTDGAFVGMSPRDLDLWFHHVHPMVWQAELWRQWSGEDLLPKLHLKEAMEWRLFLSLNEGMDWTLEGRSGHDRWMHLLIASRLKAPSAQWLASQLENLTVKDWVKVHPARRVWEFLFWDPTVPAEAPQLPCSRWFPQSEVFIARSHWKIPSKDGWVFEIRCRPPMTRPALRESNTRANFHLVKPANGHFNLAIGDVVFFGSPDHGYYPLTNQTNCVTIDGQGQIGEHDWLGPRVVESEMASIEAHEEELVHGPLADLLEADRLERLRMNLQPCYPRSMGVERYVREVLIFRRPDGIAGIGIRDEIRTRKTRRFCARAHTSGFLEAMDGGQWRIRKQNGELWMTVLTNDRMKTGIHPTEFVRGYIPPAEGETAVQHLALENETPSRNFNCILLLTNRPVSSSSLNELPANSLSL